MNEIIIYILNNYEYAKQNILTRGLIGSLAGRFPKQNVLLNIAPRISVSRRQEISIHYKITYI